MSIECIAEFITILNKELNNNTKTIKEVDNIEKSYKELYFKFIEEINNDTTILPENKIIALDLFESSNILFENMIVFKKFLIEKTI